MKYPEYDYAVIGGDMRQVYLAEELAHHTNRICHFALLREPEQSCCSKDALVASMDSFDELGMASCIICPIPFCKNGTFLNQSAYEEDMSMRTLFSNLRPGQTFFAGCIPEAFRTAAMKKGVRVYDLMQDVSLSYFNTIATAEGAICEAIANSICNLHQSRCAVLGYGKCGRMLVQDLKGMSCQVQSFSDEEEELSQACLTADRTGSLSDFGMLAGEFDFIFNTVPAPVISANLLSAMRKNVTIIDIASSPGGVDFEAAKKLGINARLCPGLPGRYAPSSSAKAIKEVIERIKE